MALSLWEIKSLIDQLSADLVTFIELILNRKLHFFLQCLVIYKAERERKLAPVNFSGNYGPDFAKLKKNNEILHT